MKAWICSEPTGVEGLVWQVMPTPAPQPREVRVAVLAASLNLPDQLVVQGRYQVRPPAPFVPGAESSGVVETVGDGVRGIEIGQRVVSIGVTGGFATHARVAARQLLPLPTAVGLDDAAAFVFTYGTAHHALADRAGLRPGESVLVLGAAGGVGTAAIQVARALGARVIAAAASAEKCRRCREIGADDSVDYANEDLRERLKALTGDRGVEVVVDPVGGTRFALAGLAWALPRGGLRRRTGAAGALVRRGPRQSRMTVAGDDRCLASRHHIQRSRAAGKLGRCARIARQE